MLVCAGCSAVRVLCAARVWPATSLSNALLESAVRATATAASLAIAFLATVRDISERDHQNTALRPPLIRWQNICV